MRREINAVASIAFRAGNVATAMQFIAASLSAPSWLAAASSVFDEWHRLRVVEQAADLNWMRSEYNKLSRLAAAR
jgi:hypothetical protein